MNDQEKRLWEHRDSDDALKLKLAQLEIINSSRKKFRAPPVKLDILASRIANKMSREAAENGYISHWNMKGEKPYQRYSFAGGYDHISENVYGEWTSGQFNISDRLVADMMKKGHASFMAEKAPRDGHKKNIIDKTHNYVGIGFYITENQFRYYEEFINRYLDFISVSSTLKVNEKGTIKIDTGGESYLFFLVCYREPFPEPVRLNQKPKTGSYDDFSRETALRIPPWELGQYRNGTIYTIPVKFNREGLYYVQIYVDEKEITTPRAITTKGYVPVSGIVIKVSGI
ncbi:MAG: CAP domain-containing protein [Bacteroidales bacterium]